MNTEEQLTKLRQEWKTATPERRFAIELKARGLKMALKAREIEDQIPDTPELLKAIFPPFQYRTQSLPTGFSIGLKNASRYALVPEKYWKTNDVIEVLYNDEKKRFTEKDVVKRMVFPDKLVEGKDYPVTYVLWKK